MLSCNSTRASICGLALSWKYNPQALGASQLIAEAPKNTILTITYIDNKIIVLSLVKTPLCKGKLVNA